MGLFFFIFVFFYCNVQLVDKILPMLGFEPQISGVGSDCSTNWATTTAQTVAITLYPEFGVSKSLNNGLAQNVPIFSW